MQDYQWALLALALLAALSLIVVILLVRVWQRERRRAQARIEELLGSQEKNLLEARRESVEKSRSALKGQIAEQMAPLLPGFPYRPADARFLGDPLDYIVFRGYTDFRDGGAPAVSRETAAAQGAPAVSRETAAAQGDALEIVLLEIKQGSSALSPSQRAIARSIQEGRVRFEVCRVAEDGTVSRETWRSSRRSLSP
jgi:predicted Holliday junction resolvase-like endonuclease